MTPHERRGTGFYGKVRTNGDFVGRGLPHEFIAQWDVWLQRGLVRARERDGDDWLSGFLGMPVWCFSMKPGVICSKALVQRVDVSGARGCATHQQCCNGTYMSCQPLLDLCD
jgi:hypothetical protein